ncbi:unnamed protein product [Rotaria sp. Silwood2]|nr:unnamed protein product [Rotaria sp. Silwood2]
MIYLGTDDVKSAANGAAVSTRTKDQTTTNVDTNIDNLTKRKDDIGRSIIDSGNTVNDSTERRASFHLGGNDDDLSNESVPRTSPATKQTGDDESLKRDSNFSRLTNASSLRKENLLSLAAKAASTTTSSSTVKPDDKVAQDRFMQYQKQAKIKAEQEKLYKEQEAKKREDEAKQARLLSRKFHEILIHVCENRFEIIMKSNIDSVQRVEPHKFSSIELNPHFIVRRYAEFSGAVTRLNEEFANERISTLMTRLQVEILSLILRMSNEFPQRKEQLIFIINNYDLILSVLTVR